MFKKYIYVMLRKHELRLCYYNASIEDIKQYFSVIYTRLNSEILI